MYFSKLQNRLKRPPLVVVCTLTVFVLLWGQIVGPRTAVFKSTKTWSFMAFPMYTGENREKNVKQLQLLSKLMGE